MIRARAAAVGNTSIAAARQAWNKAYDRPIYTRTSQEARNK